jgi:uncharacterized membrane protein
MNTTLVFAGVLIMAVSVPMILRLVPRNPLYGFRTPRTLRSDAVWYPANQFAGVAMACAGAVWTLAAVIFASPTALTIGMVALFGAFAASLVYLFRL